MISVFELTDPPAVDTPAPLIGRPVGWYGETESKVWLGPYPSEKRAFTIAYLNGED